MKEADWDALERYVLNLQRMLGLGHWEIPVKRGHCEDGHRATIELFETRYSAYLRVHRDWLSFTQEEHRKIIVHELVHVHHRDITMAVECAKGGMGDGPAFAVFEQMMEQAEERSADALALAIAPHMPLPVAVPS